MAHEAEWRILNSTMLRAVRYDEGARQLRVRFATGAVYRYYDVPPEIAQTLLDPPGRSRGRYFNDNIRDTFDYDEELP